jgi:hypothetical protein
MAWRADNRKENEEGERILDMVQAHDLALVNTFFKKKEEHLVIFKSGGNRSVIDYLGIRRDHLSVVKICKVVTGESISPQHRLLIADLNIRRRQQRKRKRIKKTKWCKLDNGVGKKFIDMLKEHIHSTDQMIWNKIFEIAIRLAKQKLGETSGRRFLEKESRFWIEEVQKVVMEKKRAFKINDKNDPVMKENNRKVYGEKIKSAKKK